MNHPEHDDDYNEEVEEDFEDVPELSARSASSRFVVVILFLLLTAAAIGHTEEDGWLTAWFIGFIFIGLPLFILCWIDLGAAIRRIPEPGPLVRVMGLFFGAPQFLLGLLALLMGAALIGWVLYNTFIERLPSYTGRWFSFGFGPALVAGGWYWMRAAFRGSESSAIAESEQA